MIDKELREIPLDQSPKRPTDFRSQVNESLAGFPTVHVPFLEELELFSIRAIFGDKSFDLIMRSRLLTTKLVARETKNTETRLRVACLKFSKLLVVGIRQTSF